MPKETKALASVVILWGVRLAFGLRATDQQIDEGLDVTQHGERAFTA